MMVLCIPLCGYTVKGGVTYTVEAARKEAFADVEYKLSKFRIFVFKTDSDYKANMKAKDSGKHILWNRELTFFSSGAYAIRYDDEPLYSYFYSKDGKLTTINKQSQLYPPYRMCKYDLKGNLISVHFALENNYTYVFKPNKEFVGYWYEDTSYTPDGEAKIKRW